MYTVDGFPLDDPGKRWYLSWLGTKLRGLPGRTSSGMVLPGRDGVVPNLTAPFEPGALGIGMSFRHQSHASLMEALELVYGVLGQRHKLLTLTHDYGDGQVRQAGINVVSAMDVEPLVQEMARIRFVCDVPGVFWRDPATADALATITAASATTTLDALAGSTGTLNDALIRIKGGISGVTLRDPVSGDTLTVSTALAGTEYLIIDCSKWTARKVTTDTWTGGTDVLSSVASNRGRGPMFTLSPEFSTGSGRVRLTVTGTNPVAAPTVTVRAKRSFL